MATDLDCGRDAAAYVLGALDDVEAAAFRRHMATCTACREDVGLLGSGSALLPLMVPQGLPAGTPARVAPASVSVSTAGPGSGRARGGPAAPATGRGLPGRKWLRQPVPKPVVVAVGALAIMAVITLVLSRGPSQATSRYVAAKTAWSGALAAVKLQSGRGALLVKGVPAAPRGKVYEIWIEHANRSLTPTDVLFVVNAKGEAAVEIPGSLRNGETVLVTEERTGGTLVPTPPAVIAAPID